MARTARQKKYDYVTCLAICQPFVADQPKEERTTALAVTNRRREPKDVRALTHLIRQLKQDHNNWLSVHRRLGCSIRQLEDSLHTAPFFRRCDWRKMQQQYLPIRPLLHTCKLSYRQHVVEFFKHELFLPCYLVFAVSWSPL